MDFSLSYPRLKLAVPPTLVRVDLPAQVLRSSLTNALTEPVFSTFKSSGLRAGRRDVLSDAQHDPPTWRLQAISVIEFHSRLAYHRATEYQRYRSEEWGCARWGDDGRACAQCSTGARELRQVVQKYRHRLGIIARGLTSTREKGLGRAAWRGRGRREEGGGEGCKEVPPKKAAPCRVDVHGPEKRGREQGSRSREGKEVREGGGSGRGRGWDAPTLARVGVDAGIARAAACRDSGCRRASAARRGYCELAPIRRNSVSPSPDGSADAELGVAAGALGWGIGGDGGSGVDAEGDGLGDAKTGRAVQRAESWEPRTRARSSVVVEVGGGVCGDTGRRKRGGGWDMRRGASTGIHRCSRGGGRRRCGGGMGRAGRDRERHECAKTDRRVERTQRDGLGNADVRAGGAGEGGGNGRGNGRAEGTRRVSCGEGTQPRGMTGGACRDGGHSSEAERDRHGPGLGSRVEGAGAGQG
ncbi:hypothetical protein B0H13DRAFT_2292500 [Mycena leptocephala]|nr:hypothetical protein B0H13DRAFT_2292500 [Mycena leptocephala]